MHSSLRQILRQHPWHPCRMFSICRVTQDAPQSFALPPARLRALISLYHLSSTFITPANLSDRIDRAFTDARNATTLTTTIYSHAELQERVKVKRNENPVGTGKAQYRGVFLDYTGRTWSDKRGVRQRRVANALWGTETDGKPALETVQETSIADENLSNLLAKTDNRRSS
jgi:hypothetical protein